jgi:hypothetical protein
VSRAAGITALLAAAVLLGCGGPSADLFVVERTGSVPGAGLRMLVSDDGVRCNDGPERPISSQQLLDARAIATDLAELDQADIPPAEPKIFGFAVRSESGTLRFADVTRRPEVLPRLVVLVRDLARNVCGLER